MDALARSMPGSSVQPRFFIVSVGHSKCLGSRPGGGSPYSSDNALQWEQWDLESSPHGGVFISSAAHDGRRLACNEHGHIYTIDVAGHDGTWETWRLEESPHGGFFVISVAHQKKLACKGHGDIYTMDMCYSGSWESWQFGWAAPTVFVSCIAHDRRLSGGPFKNVLSTGNWLSWEKWVMESSPHGGVFLSSPAHGGKRLACNADRHLYTACASGTWETWRLDESQHGGCFLTCAAHGVRLACNHRGDVYAIGDEHDGKWETWSLHATAPHNGPNWDALIHAGIGAGVGALALGILAPLVVPACVGALGFGSSGIVAGSAAAAMMSAEAAALGGGVAAGGVVATLQSLGALGLGTMGTAAAAASGAAVGAAAGGAIGAP